MVQFQHADIDAVRRHRPAVSDLSLAAERAAFADRLAKPLPDDVAMTETTLGGRPALEVTPTAAPTRGVLLFLHGGGYSVGSARTGASLAAELVRRTGVRALSLEYRLAPEHPYPAALNDALAAYRELLSDYDAAEIGIAGDSAGGGLTVALLLAARAVGLPQPGAAVVFSPFVDLTLSGASYVSRAGVDPIFTRDRMAPFVQRYLGGTDAATPLASPLLADLRGLAPLLVQVGANEVLLDDAVGLATRAAAADVDVALHVYPGLTHVFQTLAGELPEADAALDEAARFLADHRSGRAVAA